MLRGSESGCCAWGGGWLRWGRASHPQPAISAPPPSYCTPFTTADHPCLAWPPPTTPHLQVLGTPTREEIHAMNPNYTEFKFPQIKAHPWAKIFSKRMPADAVDLVGGLLLAGKGG